MQQTFRQTRFRSNFHALRMVKMGSFRDEEDKGEKM